MQLPELDVEVRSEGFEVEVHEGEKHHLAVESVTGSPVTRNPGT